MNDPRVTRASVLGLTRIAAYACALAACTSDAATSDDPPRTAMHDSGVDAPANDGGAPASEGGVATPRDDAGALDGAIARDAADAAPWACPAGPFGAPIPPGARAVAVANVPPADGVVHGEGVLEGPLFLRGALYMTHFENHAVPSSRIWKWALGGAATVLDANSGANGLAADANGNIVAALHSTGAVVRLTGAGAPEVLASGYGGARFNSPNDLALRADGTIYVSDPDWQSPSPRPQAKTRVYRISPAGLVSVVDEDLMEPNGVTLAPDGAHLYVSGLSGVYRYDVQSDGSVRGKSPFAPSLAGSDGMGVDCAGNLYVAYENGVVVLSAAGAELDRIPVDANLPVTNVAFGGTDRKTLYITHRGTSQGLHQIALNVPGLPY